MHVVMVLIILNLFCLLKVVAWQQQLPIFECLMLEWCKEYRTDDLCLS